MLLIQMATTHANWQILGTVREAPRMTGTKAARRCLYDRNQTGHELIGRRSLNGAVTFSSS